MSTEPKPAPANLALVWTGRVLSALPVMLLLFSASMKFILWGAVAKEMEHHLGWSTKLVYPLGVIELISTILYVIPQTSVVGAILITGYMGGAIATHLRIGEGIYLQATVPVLVWLGLFLREPRLRSILPWRS